MRKQLKHQLQRWPALYHFVVYVIYTLRFRYWMELLFGTRVREKGWATRHLRKGNDWNNRKFSGGGDEWVLSYWDSRDHSHRSFLLERISTFAPISCILEIGCNCGPNLYLIAKRFPKTEARGIDINPRAVQKGNELFASEGISNVSLSVGKADELGQFDDKSFDIVLTDAVLMYIGPDKIKEVVREMVRIAHRALILVEWHCFEPQGKDPAGLGVRSWGSWKRDYVALLKQFIPEEQIHVTKITKDVWPDERWSELGAVIEALLDEGTGAEHQPSLGVSHKL